MEKAYGNVIQAGLTPCM